MVGTHVTEGLAITFQRLGREHFELLGHWLAEPHVGRWWNHDPSPEAIENDFAATVDGSEPAQDFIALVHGDPVGVIQFCFFHDYPEYVAEMVDVYPVGIDAATIDYFIGEPTAVGQGPGTAMIGQFVARIWIEEPDVGHLVVPVNSANVASWKALLSAGFRLVGRGELAPDNPIDDRMHEILRIDRPAKAPGSSSPALSPGSSPG